MDVVPDSDEERNHGGLGFSDDEPMDLFPPALHLGVTGDTISTFVTPLALPSLPPPFAFRNESTISEFTPRAVYVPPEQRAEVNTSLSSIQLTGVGASSDTSAHRDPVANPDTAPPKKKGPPRPRRLPPQPRSVTSTSAPSTSTSISSIPLMVPTMPRSATTPFTHEDRFSSLPKPTTTTPKPVQFFETQSSDLVPPKSAAKVARLPGHDDDPLLLRPTKTSKSSSPSEMRDNHDDARDVAKEEAAGRKRNVTYTSSAESIHGHVVPAAEIKAKTDAPFKSVEPIVLSSDPVDDPLPIPTAADRVKMRKRKSADVSSGERKRSKIEISDGDESEREEVAPTKRKPKGRIQDSDSEFEIEKKAAKKSKSKDEDSGSDFELVTNKPARKRKASSLKIDDDDDDDDDEHDSGAYKTVKKRKSTPDKPRKAVKDRRLMSHVEITIPVMQLNGRGRKEKKTEAAVTLSKSRKATRAELSSPESDSPPSSRPPSPVAPPAKRRKSEPAPKKTKAATARNNTFKSAEFIVSDDDSPSGDEALVPDPVPVAEPKSIIKQRAKTEASKPATPPSTPPKAKEAPSQRRKRERARARALKEQGEGGLIIVDVSAAKKEEPKKVEKEKAASKPTAPKPAAPKPATPKPSALESAAPARTMSKPTTNVIAKENVPPVPTVPPTTSVTPKPRPKMEGTLAHSIPNKALSLSAPRRPRFGLSKSSKLAPLHPKRKTPPPPPPPVQSKKKKKVESDAEDEEEEIATNKRKGDEEDWDWEQAKEQAMVED
ncbi:hypothetical protein CALVIDRAFT_552243 [Calocera viscosa TUFC12733]|uniref:Uncharacterized protein n=1 Tax=Calocera viscosa (strain TUFC12733) TaxID=1330018 RepID=A0A167RPA4_CALVF|nr:hypothetical protein CALVIDRAFT_552243 [Calocera viscosa TUFC12733]